MKTWYVHIWPLWTLFSPGITRRPGLTNGICWSMISYLSQSLGVASNYWARMGTSGLSLWFCSVAEKAGFSPTRYFSPSFSSSYFFSWISNRDPSKKAKKSRTARCSSATSPPPSTTRKSLPWDAQTASWGYPPIRFLCCCCCCCCYCYCYCCYCYYCYCCCYCYCCYYCCCYCYYYCAFLNRTPLTNSRKFSSLKGITDFARTFTRVTAIELRSNSKPVPKARVYDLGTYCQ